MPAVTPPDPTDDLPSPPRRRALAVTGLLLAFLGPFVLALLIDHPLWRSTGLPAFVLMGLGSALALRAWRGDRRRATRVVAATAWLLTGFFAWGFFLWARMPQSETFARLTQAPDFVLPDQDGTPVALADLRARGPVHLVFYRGFW